MTKTEKSGRIGFEEAPGAKERELAWKNAIAGVELELLKSRIIERKQPGKSRPPVSQLVREYRSERTKGRYWNRPKVEMRALEQMADKGGLTSAEWVWLGRRYRTVMGLIFHPTPRQKVVGAKVGPLSREEQKWVDMRRVLEEITALVESER